jgi:alpha-ketoglutarate-dependent taurine dioxygenase
MCGRGDGSYEAWRNIVTGFQCRWTWRRGDVAIWDNRETLHYAVAGYGDAERVIHRVTLCGEAPFA